MTKNELISIIERLSNLKIITEFDEASIINATFDAEKLNFEYFNICNDLEKHFLKLYLKDDLVLLEKILQLLNKSLTFWQKIEKNPFFIDLSLEGSEHLKTRLTEKELESIAKIKTFYLNGLIKNIESFATPKTKAKPVFKISDKTGAKTDLIRVLNALYEIHLLDRTDGLKPSKKEFMETMGEYLGVDLKKYHSNLSQALQNQTLEVNLQVFEDMKNVTQKTHYQNKDK
jgi:hypothetical protein